MGEIVKNSILLDTVTPEKGNNKKMPGTAFMHSFYTVAPVNGKSILLKLFAEEALSLRNNDIFTRAYSLKYIEKVADIDNGVHSKGGLTGSQSATINTVAALFELVKRYDKEFKDETGNVLYLTVSMHEINEADIVAYTRAPQDGTASYAPPASEYKLAEIFRNVNAEDGEMLKYIPDGFLGAEQISAKKAELERAEQYIERKNSRYNRTSLEGGDELKELQAENKRLRERVEYFKGQNNAGIKAREYLESLGYDGANNSDEEYIAFYPEQIKSAENNCIRFLKDRLHNFMPIFKCRVQSIFLIQQYTFPLTKYPSCTRMLLPKSP